MSPPDAPPRSASSLTRTLSHAGLELRLLARNGESLLVTLAIPAAVLLFFSFVPVLPLPGPPVDSLAPGALAIAAMGSAMVALGIATAFEREHGVLARMGTTPLRRVELIAAKALAVLAVQAGQVGALVAVAAAIGWRPMPTVVGAALAISGWLAATIAFAGLGLLLAGRLPALRALATINAAFLVLLLLAGVVVPLELLPGPAAIAAQALPAAWTTTLLADAAAAGEPWGPLGVLLFWAIGAVLAATATFQWDERA